MHGAGGFIRVFDFNSAIVRAPARSVVDGLRAGAGPSPLYEKVLAEHRSYVASLESAGVHVTALDPLEAFPDSIFVEDPALVFSDAAILLRPGAPSRIGEARELAGTLAAHFPELLQLRDGFVDGGDVLVLPGQILIGLSSRTDPAGAAGLQALLNGIGRSSRLVETPRGTLHLKSDCALLDEETVLATRGLADSKVLAGYRVLVVPDDERHAANAIRVNDVVFTRSDCPRTQDMIAGHGPGVVPLKVAEIAKIDAGLSCLSLRWFDTRRGPQGPGPSVG